jgi:phosphomevalonate kinase
VSVPAKLILFGEWAVLEGAPAVATTLEKRLRLDFERRSSASGVELCSLDSTTENSDSFRWNSSQAHVPLYFALAAETLRSLDLVPEQASYLARWTREWKLEEGLGSSSAVVLTSLLAARLWRGEAWPETKSELDRFCLAARESLRALQGGVGSGLDLSAQLVGQSLVFDTATGARSLELAQARELVVVHTGQKMKTASALAQQERKPQALQKIHDSTNRFLKNQNWLEAIETHFEALSDLGVVPDFVSQARHDWKARGLIETLKTTGAGGGDALLVWVKSEALDAFKNEIHARRWWISNAKWNAQGARLDDLR